MAEEPKKPATRAGLPFETLQDKVLFSARFSCRKHGLAHDIDQYAEERVNELSNMDLLRAISEALEETTDGND